MERSRLTIIGKPNPDRIIDKEHEALICSIMEALGEAGLTKVVRYPDNNRRKIYVMDDPGHDYTMIVLDGQIHMKVAAPAPASQQLTTIEKYDLADPEVFNKITKRIRHWEHQPKTNHSETS